MQPNNGCFHPSYLFIILYLQNTIIHFSWNTIKTMTNLSDPTDKGAPRVIISTGAIWSNTNVFLRIRLFEVRTYLGGQPPEDNRHRRCPETRSCILSSWRSGTRISSCTDSQTESRTWPSLPLRLLSPWQRHCTSAPCSRRSRSPCVDPVSATRCKSLRLSQTRRHRERNHPDLSWTGRSTPGRSPGHKRSPEETPAAGAQTLPIVLWAIVSYFFLSPNIKIYIFK